MSREIMMRWSRGARQEMKGRVQAIAVDPRFWPSVHQYATWVDLVHWPDGCDPDGYFLGECPFQFVLGRREGHMARWNFDRGVVRCDDGCADGLGRTVSLSTVASMMAARLIDVNG